MSNTAPLGYKRVEYLESTGTQYIDTGVYGNLNTKTEIKASVSSNTQTNQQLFGSIGTDNSITMNIGSGNIVRFGSKQYTFNAYDYITIDVPSIFLINKNNINIDGEDTGSFNETNNFTTESTMYLMAANGSTSLKFNGKVYYCKIYDNDVLVRDYIPVLNENNEAGLYDLINKEFYGNSGTGSFQYGDIIPEGTIAEKLNYSLEAKELIKDGINYLGGNVTDETTLKEYRDELDSVYNKLPKVSNSTASDNVILYPTLKGRIDSTLKGQIGQDTTNGDNILKITDYTNLSLTANGNATVTKNTDKIIISTTTDDFSGAFIFKGNFANMIKDYDSKKTYYLSADVTFPNNTTFAFGKESNSPVNYSAGKQHIESSFTNGNIIFYNYGVAITITMENIMIAETANKEYEPYTGRNIFPKSKL